MQQTIILSLLRRLEAFIVLTNDDLCLLWHVLSEVQSLRRKHLGTDRFLKVLIRYDAVAIEVETFEDVFEFFVGDRDAPEVQVVLQLTLAYLARFLNIEIHESFAERFPLDADLVDDSSLHITSLHFDRCLNLIISLESFLILQMFIQLRIFN